MNSIFFWGGVGVREQCQNKSHIKGTAYNPHPCALFDFKKIFIWQVNLFIIQCQKYITCNNKILESIRDFKGTLNI